MIIKQETKDALISELVYARKKYPEEHMGIMAWAICLEKQMDDLAYHIEYTKKGRLAKLKRELMQIACVALRAYEDL